MTYLNTYVVALFYSGTAVAIYADCRDGKWPVILSIVAAVLSPFFIGRWLGVRFAKYLRDANEQR